MQLVLLMDGAWIASQVFRRGDHSAICVARAAKSLLEAYRGPA
jgi:hypothetical protein